MLVGEAMVSVFPNRVASLSLSAMVSPWEYVRPSSAVWESASRVYSPLGQILCGSHDLGRAPTISASPPLGHTLAKLSLVVRYPSTLQNSSPSMGVGYSKRAPPVPLVGELLAALRPGQ